MMPSQTEEWFKKIADFYGLSIAEAKERYKKVNEQGDNPKDPICVGCAKRPQELPEYTSAAREANVAPNDYVTYNEGTFNRENGHFLCDTCYIKNGMPSSERGWVAP
jgi:hypothetical protein